LNSIYMYKQIATTDKRIIKGLLVLKRSWSVIELSEICPILASRYLRIYESFQSVRAEEFSQLVVIFSFNT
jgi:hypothetical protein